MKKWQRSRKRDLKQWKWHGRCLRNGDGMWYPAIAADSLQFLYSSLINIIKVSTMPNISAVTLFLAAFLIDVVILVENIYWIGLKLRRCDWQSNGWSNKWHYIWRSKCFGWHRKSCIRRWFLVDCFYKVWSVKLIYILGFRWYWSLIINRIIAFYYSIIACRGLYS